jgi:hypothetical protein
MAGVVPGVPAQFPGSPEEGGFDEPEREVFEV